MMAVPFVVGQWVRGDRFYGRQSQIAEILEGPRDAIWLLGTRRIGKTSLLKQIEYIAATATEPRYFPVFWDFQGAEVSAELHANFAEALLDADERLERLGIGLEDVEADDLFVSIGRLRRKLRDRNLGLLLLCDEVEELIKLHRKDLALLRKLRHVLLSHGDVRAVLASTIRLWTLADERVDTSPFLHGFTPPLYIERLSDGEARELVEQSHLRPDQRPLIPNDAVGEILARCDNHPYLVQLVCKRYVETGGLEEAIEQVATDRMVSHFFSVDFEMLSDPERRCIRQLARDPGLTVDAIRTQLGIGADALEGDLRRMENLGFIRRTGERRIVLANYFFRRWLQSVQEDVSRSAELEKSVVPSGPAPVIRVGDREAVGNYAGEPQGLFAELRRRSVFRVGLAYVAAAWVLLQVGDILFSFLEVPRWAGRMLLAILALGLPCALILAWAFALTPQGIRRQREVDRSPGLSSRSGRRLDFVIIAFLALAVALLLLDKFT